MDMDRKRKLVGGIEFGFYFFFLSACFLYVCNMETGNKIAFADEKHYSIHFRGLFDKYV